MSFIDKTRIIFILIKSYKSIEYTIILWKEYGE